jgi:hypothetical protein
MLRAFCHTKILASVVLMLLYVLGLIEALHAVGMWNIGLLKDTIIWFFVGALAMMVRFATANDTENLFRRIVKDSVKIVIVLEFLVNTYTFPLAVELILVPILTFIAMIDAFTSMHEEYAIVAKITNGLQAVVGFVILGIALRRAVADWQTLNSLDTFRSIALAPVLSVCMFPFVYVMLVVSQYEQLFISLDFGTKKSPRLKRYMRRRVMMHAGLRLYRLRLLRKHHLVDLIHVQRNQDVERILVQVRKKEQSPDADPAGHADTPSGSAES